MITFVHSMNKSFPNERLSTSKWYENKLIKLLNDAETNETNECECKYRHHTSFSAQAIPLQIDRLPNRTSSFGRDNRIVLQPNRRYWKESTLRLILGSIVIRKLWLLDIENWCSCFAFARFCFSVTGFGLKHNFQYYVYFSRYVECLIIFTARWIHFEFDWSTLAENENII